MNSAWAGDTIERNFSWEFTQRPARGGGSYRRRSNRYRGQAPPPACIFASPTPARDTLKLCFQVHELSSPGKRCSRSWATPLCILHRQQLRTGTGIPPASGLYYMHPGGRLFMQIRKYLPHRADGLRFLVLGIAQATSDTPDIGDGRCRYSPEIWRPVFRSRPLEMGAAVSSMPQHIRTSYSGLRQTTNSTPATLAAARMTGFTRLRGILLRRFPLIGDPYRATAAQPAGGELMLVEGRRRSLALRMDSRSLRRQPVPSQLSRHQGLRRLQEGRSSAC